MPRAEDGSLTLAAETMAAKAELEKQGYKLAAKPLSEIPKLPQRITEWSDEELMELMTRKVRWMDHISGVLGLQEVDERYADSAYDLIWATVLADAATGRPKSESSVTLAKADTTMHPNVVAARDHKNLVYARRKVIQMLYDRLERDSFLLSRELSRRIGREPRERRADRWNP